jgi:hypothetical protein
MVIKFPRLSQYPSTTGQCSKGACGFISTLSSLRCCSITTALCTLSTPNVHTLHPLRTFLYMIILHICILHLHFPNPYLWFLGHVILHIPILHFRPLRLLLPVSLSSVPLILHPKVILILVVVIIVVADTSQAS